MFERYSERARRTIFHAKYEALARGSQEIEPKDIVMGLTYDAHQQGCPFAKLHDEAPALRGLVGSERALHGPPENKDIPLSSRSKRVLAYADLEGRRDRRYTIGSDHLLRGVLRERDQTAKRLIRNGYTLSATRAASAKAQKLSPDVLAPPGWKGYPVSLRRTRYDWALLILAAIVSVLLCIAASR